MARFLTGLALALFMIAGEAAAQSVSSTTGAINGRLTDNTGAVLPGVTMAISSPALMGIRTAVTGNDGNYRFPAVPPGDYKIVFELAGFTTVTREDIRVGLGFTATVNIELGVASLEENVTVTGASPVVDTTATKVATSFDREMLANLPSARDQWAILAEAPAIKMTRIDVGGSAAGTQSGYFAYGTTGQNQPMVEGINSTEGTGGFGNYVDIGSFDEVVVSTAGNGADMAMPGVQMQFISKSGGNTYHGAFVGNYQRDNWQSYNIDAAQIAAGVTGGGGLQPRDVNRMWRFRDLNADVGGFLLKDRLWWFLSVLDLDTAALYTNFPVKPHRTRLSNITSKFTFNLTPNNKIISYLQPSRKFQFNRLDRYLLGAQVAFHTSELSTFKQTYYPRLYKLEYNTVLNDAVFMEVRAGQWGYNWPDFNYSTDPSYEDLGTNEVSGAARKNRTDIRRNQGLASLSFFKDGWGGSHNFKFGADIYRETTTQSRGAGAYNDVLHVLRNGAPIEVYWIQTPSKSENGLWWYDGYAMDTWRLNSRLTLNLGLRFDRYRNFLPEQEHPAGRFTPAAQTFAAVDDLNHWTLFGPRIGATYDISGNGRTIIKANYGQYWWNPGYDLSGQANPNAPEWFRRFVWTDPNGNRVWDPGEEGRLLAQRGGTLTSSLDPNLKDPFTREAVIWLERELVPNFGVRTGFVWRGQQQAWLLSDANQPYSAFNVPVNVPDPGPDGRVGNSDDGAPIQAFNLDAAHTGLTPRNVVSNVPDSDSDFYTWELTGTKRMSNNWSMLAAYSVTWNYSQSNAYFNINFRQNQLPITPNDRINGNSKGQHEFTDQQFKLHGTWQGPWALKVTPIVRYQRGQNWGRVISATLNYGPVRTPAEPLNTRRQDDIAVLDARVEKVFNIAARVRLSGFVDVFNILNANPTQNLTWQSGASFLRPSNILPPRILRIGTKFDW